MYIDCFAYKNTNQLSSYQLFPWKNYEKHRGGASRQGARSPRECPPNMSHSPLANANIVTFMGKGCPKGRKGVLWSFYVQNSFSPVFSIAPWHLGQVCISQMRILSLLHFRHRRPTALLKEGATSAIRYRRLDRTNLADFCYLCTHETKRHIQRREFY